MGLDHLLTHGQTKETPQSEAMPGRESEQVANSAGGFVWEADGWSRLRRFLVLGTEGGSYYADERELTLENVKQLRELVAEDGARFVAEVVSVSQAGRAPKNEYALYALAAAIAHGDRPTRRLAAEAVPLVARTGTHLLHFAAYAQSMRGWGKTLRWAVSNWFLSKEVDALAYQAVKYRQRDGWSMRDLLRLSHPKTDDQARDLLLKWIVTADKPSREAARVVLSNETKLADFNRPDEGVTGGSRVYLLPEVVMGYETARLSDTPTRTAELVREYGLPREALRSEHLTDPDVWRAMIWRGMPMTALMRNLATMTRLGVLEGEWRDAVVQQLADGERVRKARVHPLNVLMALKTYASGRGFRGANTWVPIPQVIDALDRAFYLAFGNVEATGKRILIAVDVSGSMDAGQVGGTPLTPREAAGALAMVHVAAEPNAEVVAFTSGGPNAAWTKPDSEPRKWWQVRDALTPVGLSSRQRLDDVVARFQAMEMGGTDCALPMRYAKDLGRELDAFVILTDNETWAGGVHPAQALQAYRAASGIPARLAVVALTPNRFTIADPRDAGMLDVVGFDTATPAILGEFIAGRV